MNERLAKFAFFVAAGTIIPGALTGLAWLSSMWLPWGPVLLIGALIVGTSAFHALRDDY